jgi:hypothetical protein
MDDLKSFIPIVILFIVTGFIIGVGVMVFGSLGGTATQTIQSNNGYDRNVNLSSHSATLTNTLCAAISRVDNGTYSITTVTSYTNWCYQETANISTACGGLSSGNYSFILSRWDSDEYRNVYKTFDGNWSSYSIPSGQNVNTTLYINYTVPVSATSALWQVKMHNTYQNITNLTIPNDCFSQTKIPLSVNIVYPTDSSATYMEFQCYNATNSRLLLNTTLSPGYIYFYEEAMWWNISTTNTTQVDNYTKTWNLTTYNISFTNAASCIMHADVPTTSKYNVTYTYNTVTISDPTPTYTLMASMITSISAISNNWMSLIVTITILTLIMTMAITSFLNNRK